ADVSSWVESGLEKYAGIRMAIAQKEGVRLQRNATRSNRLPTVDLSASYTISDVAPTYTTDPTDSTVGTIGLTVSMPLFTGGSLYAQSKQSASNLATADYQLEQQ
ncbi:TolC family protein, partial [Gilvimarinus sp. 1_MG-2023]